MKEKIIVFGLILVMAFSVSSIAISEQTVDLTDEIEVRIHPSGLFGMTMAIENIGEDTVTDLPWNFAYKLSIGEKGLLFNEKSQDGLISSLAAGETFTVDFSPFDSEMTSPLGFGDIYFNASAGSDILVRHQHRGFLLFAFMGPYKDTYIDISADIAYQMMQQEMFDMIIDVSPHFEEKHIPGSVNYYIGDGSLDSVLPSLDKDLNYLVYCHVDSASVPGAQKLVDAGIENVYRLEGNYPAWVDAGYPVITPSGYIDITAQEAKSMIDSNPELIVIDVSPIYDDGHIPGSVNYYVGDGSLDNAIPSLDKDKDYLVYCHTDSASILGAEKLVDSGFDSVYRLEGNFQAWVDEGYVVEPSDSYIDITVHQAKSMIDSNPELIVIDVSPNYDDGHIPGAVNYYVGDGSLDDAIPMLDMNKDYLVYCHVDSASILGAEKLVDAGFDPVYRLEGNYVAWVDAGYPVES